MSDEIYDYFGGSSPRKMEPLDASEMFEDLLPSREPELTEERTAEMVADVDFDQDADAILAEAARQDDIGIDSKDQPASTGRSHWDDLASSLGLAPPPRTEPIKTARPAVAERKRDNIGSRKAKTEIKGMGDPEFREVIPPQGDKLSKLPNAPKQAADSDADNVTELFFSPEEIDFESISNGNDDEAEDDFEHDPFAAFSGSQSPRRQGQESKTEIDESQPEILDIKDPVSKDFVEFEVQDIGGQRRDERETRSKRGRRPDRPEKRSGRDQVQKPTEHKEKEPVSESRERGRGHRQQQAEPKRREPARNEARRGRQEPGSSSSEGDRADGNRTQGSRGTEGSRAEGSRAEGSRAEGSRTEGNRAEDSRAEDSRAEGSRVEGNRPRGNQAEGNRRRRSGRDTSKRDSIERDPASRKRNSADRELVKSDLKHDSSDDDPEIDDGIKKARIPTWDEAIGGVVEQNIKRHKSITKGGGKRRRN